LRKGLPLIPLQIKKGLNTNSTENYDPQTLTNHPVSQQPATQHSISQPATQHSISQHPNAGYATSEDDRSENLSRKERRRLRKEEQRRKKKKLRDERRRDASESEEDNDDIVGNLIGAPGKKSTREHFTSDEEDGFDLDSGDEELGSDEDDEELGSDEEGSEIEKDVEVEKDKEEDPYAGLSPEEREEKEKEEYIWRFRILRKKYKNAEEQIPTFNEFSDLQTMKRTYDRTVRELYLDDAVESYRGYLMGGSIIIEFAATQWFDVDLGGFTIHQTKMMYKYDRLLIELGEKSYNQWGSTIPVELRLLLMILFQAGLFYMAKVVTARFGTTIADLFRSVSGMPPPAEEIKNKEGGEQAQAGGPPKAKMRGPKIKPSELRTTTEVEDEQEEDA
jgi:hypothetical protein